MSFLQPYTLGPCFLCTDEYHAFVYFSRMSLSKLLKEREALLWVWRDGGTLPGLDFVAGYFHPAGAFSSYPRLLSASDPLACAWQVPSFSTVMVDSERQTCGCFMNSCLHSTAQQNQKAPSSCLLSLHENWEKFARKLNSPPSCLCLPIP